MKRRHQKVTGAVAREGTAGTIRAVRGRSEPHEQQSCIRIAEPGHGPTPVRVGPMRTLLLSRHSLAIPTQARASVAGHNGRVHSSQLWRSFAATLRYI